MGQLFPLPLSLERQLARLARSLDQRLPRRARGRIGRLFNRSGQRFLAPGIEGVAEFRNHLSTRGIKHVVLADGPSTHPLVLIDDEDVDAVRKFLSPWPTGDAIGVYSTTGPQGFAFGDIPLFAPRLARQLLEDEIKSDHKVRARHIFLAKLYRYAFYGDRAPDRLTNRVKGHPSLPADLGDEARVAGLQLSSSPGLDEIYQLLEREHWTPPLETLERIAVWNPVVARRLARKRGTITIEGPGLVVFYVRQRAVELGMLGSIVDRLRDQGFERVDVNLKLGKTLSEIAEEVRGGNWGRGPYPVSGGPPSEIIVAIDRQPAPPSVAMLKQFPMLDNEHIQAAKQAIRDAVGSSVARSEQFNALHSTDNATQAWRAVRAHFPRDAETLYQEIHTGKVRVRADDR